MLLRLCLHRSEAPGAGGEVVLEAPPGATWADAVPAVSTYLGLSGPVRAVVAARAGSQAAVLGPDFPIGHPPLVHGASLALGPAPEAHPAETARAPGATVHVVAGPDAGHVAALGEHALLVGRDPGCGIVLTDRRVSRRHLLLLATEQGVCVCVRDLHSTNGALLGDRPVGDGPRPWRAPEAVRIGDSMLRLRPRTPTSAGTVDGDGTVRVNPAPLVAAGGSEPEPLTLRLPARREPARPVRFPFLLVLLPLIASLAVAFALRNPLFLLIGLLSPALTLGHVVGDRRDRRREQAQTRRELARSREALADTLERRAAVERAALDRAHPDPAAVAVLAVTARPPLWAHAPPRPGALAMRVGVACVESPWTRVVDGAEEPRFWLPDAPLVVDLDTAVVLGVTGTRERALGLARDLLAQLAVRCSPTHLRIIVLAAGASRARAWRWCSWLPHAAGEACTPAETAAVLTGLRRRPETAAPARTLLVLDGAAQLRTAGLARVLRAAPDRGLRVLCVADSAAELPAECRTVLDVERARAAGRGAASDGRAAATGPGLPRHRDARLDGTGEAWALTVARALAPLRDVDGLREGGHPPVAGDRDLDLFDLIGLDPGDPLALARRWAACPRGVRVPVGVGPAGPHALDLDVDGPHVLVGGMTGSGKSEFLRSLVCALAAANRPDELGFVLVDYKGGAAFAGCARLPHTLGLVTDLDDAQADRALRSLTGELRRRERALAEVGARDHADYLRSRDEHPGRPPLPRLVVVVDEFRALAEDRPGFVPGLVRIASLGRSLGVHLVLATQRPAGVVSAEIRANCALRIALRVRDRIDSQDVIDADDAAGIPAGRPGQAYLRVGGGELCSVQVARVGARPGGPGAAPGGAAARGRPPAVRVRPFVPGRAADRPASGPAVAPAAALDRFVRTVAAAADRVGVPPVAPPWLPPLPELVTDRDLADAGEPSLGDGHVPPGVVYGLADDPEGARRVPAAWVPEHGNLAVVGAARSGRSTALSALAFALARARPRGAVHLHVLHGGLAPALPDAPGLLGVVVGADEPARLRRAVLRLELDLRDRLRAPGPEDDDGPLLVVLVDDWPRVRDALEGEGRAGVGDRFVELVRTARSARMSWAVAGDHTLLRGSVLACFTDVLLLGRADPADLTGLGWSPRAVVPDLPGRGRRRSDGREVQVVSTPVRSRARPGPQRQSWRGLGGSVPWDIPTLPADVCLSELPEMPGPTGSRVVLPLGRSAGTEPLACWDVTDGALVCGPRGSGRTTALMTLAAALARRGHPHVLVRPGGGTDEPVTSDECLAVCGPRDTAALETLLRRTARLFVLVDDLDRLAGSDIEGVLEGLVPPAATGSVLVAATTSEQAAAGYRGTPAALRRTGTGVILWPRPADREVFGVAVPTGEARTPGRGVLVHRGEAEEIQLARPGQHPGTSPSRRVAPRGDHPDHTDPLGSSKMEEG